MSFSYFHSPALWDQLVNSVFLLPLCVCSSLSLNNMVFRSIGPCAVENPIISVLLALCLCGSTSISQFSHPVVYDSLWSHEPQHARPPCPSPTPGVYPNSCPLSRWYHPTILSSVIPFSSCPQSFPASGSFPMSQLFASGGQSIGVSASTSVLPVNIQNSFRMDWLDLLAVQGTLKSLLQHHSSKASILQSSAFFRVQLTSTYDHWKNHSLD